MSDHSRQLGCQFDVTVEVNECWQFPGQIERASKTLEIERLTDLATCIPSVAIGQRLRHC